MVFSLYFIVALIVTVSHMMITYDRMKDLVFENLVVFHQTFGPGLSSLLWDLDEAGMNVLINGMIEIPMIVGVKVEDHTGKKIGEAGKIIIRKSQPKPDTTDENSIYGEDMFSGLFWYNFTLKYQTDMGQPVHLGTATIYSSSRIVFDKVKSEFILIVVNAIIKTLALWILFLWLSRIILTRPLTILTRAVERLNLDNLENYQDIDVKTSGKNELKVLETAFNSTVGNLLSSRKELENAQHRLEVLLDVTKEMARSEMIPFMVMEKAVRSILEVLTGVYNIKSATIYYREKIKTKFKYVYFKFPISFNDKGIPSLKMSPKEVEHALADKIPFVVEHNVMLKASFVIEDTLYVPCWDENVLLGLIEISGIGNKDFTKEFQEFVDTLEQSLIISLKNLEANLKLEEQGRVEEEMKTAAAVQRSLLPKTFPQVANVELARFFQSASSTGGDWYGFTTQIKNKLFLFIGDVTGHGVPAALVAASVSGASQILEEIHVLYKEPPSPREFLEYLNKIVFKAGDSEFVMTFFLVSIDLESGLMTFANAGHNFPLLIRQGQRVKRLISIGNPLGEYQEMEFEDSTLQLDVGDTVLLYTDGLIENRNSKGKMWGDNTLYRYLSKQDKVPVETLVETLVKDAFKFYEEQPLDDDITIVAFQIVSPFPQRENPL